MRRHFLVCYDIREPKRLKRVHKIVRDFGEPLQYSVFACRMTECVRAELERRLLEEIDQRVDNVMIVDVGPAGSPVRERVPGMRILGKPTLPDVVGVIVV